MPVPIRWKCCVEGCGVTSSNEARVAQHELTHFSPRYKAGDVIGTLTVLRARVKRRIVGGKAGVFYDVDSDVFRDGNHVKMTFAERTLVEEEEKAKEGKTFLD